MKSKEDKNELHAIIIAEPFTTSANPSLYPLSPLTPSADLPYALLPVCNTPVINYILENLVENKVDKATILVDVRSAALVRAHLSKSCTARGKPWLASDAIAVELVECGRHVLQLSDAAQELLDHNIVAQNGSFLFVPIDCVAFIADLRGAFQTHLARAAADPSYTATLLCTSDRDALEETLHNVLVRALLQREEGSAAQRDDLERGEQQFLPGSFSSAEYDKYRNYVVPAVPRTGHTMFQIDETSHTVLSMSRLKAGEGPSAASWVSFHRKKRQSIRMDLQPTGFLFCTSEALPLIDFHIEDTYSFLSAAILGQVEITGKHFGVLELPRAAVVEPISGLESYIAANLNVCARRLFPLTRESCFAEAQTSYAVSYGCDTVYQHTTAKVADQLSGPHVVVGPEVHLSAVELVGTVCGASVTIGENSSLTSCVLLDRAVVGRRCVLRGCVVGQGAVIGDNVEVVNSIIGHGCVIQKSGDGPGLAVHHQAVCDCDAAGSDAWLVGPEGHGRVLVEKWSNPCCATAVLFTEDPQAARAAAGSDDDDDEGDEDDEMEVFRRRIKTYVEEALLHPSSIEASVYDMSTVRFNYNYGHAELCEVVTELLVEHVLEDDNTTDVPSALQAMRTLFAQWCRPFYDGLVWKDGEERLEPMLATLEGLCGAIRRSDCLLHRCGAPLMELLYNDCDGDLYNERGFCIVSAQALFEFDQKMAERSARLQRYTGFKGRADDSTSDSSSSDDDDDDDDDMMSRDSVEEGKVLVAQEAHSYIMGVKEFLES